MKFLDKRDDFQQFNLTNKGVGTYEENREASYEMERLLNTGTGRNEAFADQYRPIIDTLNENRKEGQQPFRNPGNVIGNNRHYEARRQRILDEIETRADEYPDLIGFKDVDIDAQARQAALEARQEMMELDSRSFGFTNWVGQMHGGFEAFLQDPSNAIATVAGGLATWPIKGFVKTVLGESVANAGIELLQQPAVAKWYEDLNLDYGFEDGLQRVAFAGLAGGAFTGMTLGAIKGAQLTYRQARSGIDALRSAGYKFTPEQEAAIRAADEQDAIDASNPLESPDTEGKAVHQQNVIDAQEAVIHDEKASLLSLPQQQAISRQVFSKFGLQFEGAQYLRPDEIVADAKTFQYKEGGDEFGVTDRLQDVETWDPTLSGIGIIWERSDGAKVVADGHQRLGLAKRIQSADPSQDPKLLVYTLREAEGWTPEQVRVVAAMKNIAEGSGTAVDAAKVLRVAPERINEMNLPPRSPLVRQAKFLTNLDDEMFGLVVNDVVAANHAAVVGQLIPENKALQEAAMRVLASSDPANEVQARAMVMQVKSSDVDIKVQDGLFGEEVIAESFYAERAKILDRAQKQIRSDKNAFEAIQKNANRYEQEGNVLNKTNNARRLSDESETLATIQALANRVGPISDALNKAAREARESGSFERPASEFIEIVRERIREGDLDGIASSEFGRHVDDTGEVQASAPRTAERKDFEGQDSVDSPKHAEQTKQMDTQVLDMIAASKAAFDEDAYIKLINPTGERVVIADTGEMSVIRTVDDINEHTDVPMGAEKFDEIDGIEYYRWENNFYAYEKEEGFLVGYQRRNEDGTELLVAEEYRGRGIGSELNFMYRSQDPKAPSGGLTEAGEAVARKTFQRFNDIVLSNDYTKHFNLDAEGTQLIPMNAITPTRARGEGMLNGRVFMKQAEEGTRDKRNPAELRDNGDGTYTLWDGNSTYALAVEAGYDHMPARVLSAEEYAATNQAKNMERIIDPKGKVKMRIIKQEESDEHVFSEFMAQMLERQPNNTIDEALTAGKVAHDELQESLSEITEELGIEGWQAAPVKEKDGVVRKINTKYAKDAGLDVEALDYTPDIFAYRVTDIARGGMTLERPELALQVLQKLNKKYHIIDEGFSQTDAGYFDGKALILMPNKVIAELQFWPPKMFDVKNSGDLSRFKVWPETYVNDAGKTKPFVGGHALYEIYRLTDDNHPVMRSVIDQNGMTPQQARDLANEHMKEIYGEVLEALDKDIWGSMVELFNKERAKSKSAPKSADMETASSSVISGDRSSLSMVSGSTSYQRPDLLSQENALELSSDMATSQMPSDLKNLISTTSEDIVTELDNMSDLFDDAYPTGDVIVAEDGTMSVQTQSIAEIKAEFDKDARISEVIKGCQL